VQIAHARKLRDAAPLACRTDKVDTRVLAELWRRDLVPAWHQLYADLAARTGKNPPSQPSRARS
jgi:DNA/RNA-binding domain of Phe-tRNA-synthetase-like protein